MGERVTSMGERATVDGEMRDRSESGLECVVSNTVLACPLKSIPEVLMPIPTDDPKARSDIKTRYNLRGVHIC